MSKLAYVGHRLGNRAMGDEAKRVAGWKAIAAHFKRDRSTVMRWTQTRGLPVYRVPGEGSSSVYAFTDELDRWFDKSRGHEENDIGDRVSAVDLDNAGIAPRANWRKRPQIIGLAAVILIAAVGSVAAWRQPRPEVLLPKNPEVAALYLQARDDWASRSASGLHRAVSEFSTVVARDPGFAPAHAGLADAYLLVREFDATPDAIAYPRAEAAARRALALDPNSDDAHRALGFIAYWWRRDIPTARASFARALRRDPDNAQTHFWFGNALVDNGQAAAGLKELELARLLEPGSQAIQADTGWALWSSGQHDEAKIQLLALAKEGRSSSPFTYLAYIALAERDWPLYLDYSDRRATLRDDDVLAKRNALERAAFRRGGAKGLLDLMASVTISDPAGVVSDSSWAASLAALAGERETLLRILQKADQRREVWGFSGFTTPVFANWQADPDIGPLLRGRKGESLLRDGLQ
jgi:tetratricopeptide (TPR) repeat protein